MTKFIKHGINIPGGIMTKPETETAERLRTLVLIIMNGPNDQARKELEETVNRLAVESSKPNPVVVNKN